MGRGGEYAAVVLRGVGCCEEVAVKKTERKRSSYKEIGRLRLTETWTPQSRTETCNALDQEAVGYHSRLTKPLVMSVVTGDYRVAYGRLTME